MFERLHKLGLPAHNAIVSAIAAPLATGTAKAAEAARSHPKPRRAIAMENIVGGFVGAIIGIAIGIVVLIVLGFVLKWLWNTTIPEISGLKEISTLQAIKLLFIAAILFGWHRVIAIPAETPPSEPAVEASAGG
jgi:hypothetical protein